jgi:signal transduction histidine kinase
MPSGLPTRNVVGMSLPGRLRDAIRGHGFATDVSVAMALYALTLLTTEWGLRPRHEHLALMTITLAALVYGAMLTRRMYPMWALVATTITADVYMALDRGQIWVLSAPLIVLYTVAETTGGRRRSLTIAWLGAIAFAGLHMLLSSSWMGPENLTFAALGGFAITLGDSSRTRRAYTAEAEERALRAERNQEEEARRRVAEERLRISRDLHDAIGHHIALINVQAGVAAHVLDTQPDRARQALAHIRQTGRTALTELRDTIQLLRNPGDPAAPIEPAVGLSGLDQLVESFRLAGLQIEQDVSGSTSHLPRAADLTAYRVIQESLTNVRKHAGRVPVRVRLQYGPGALKIVVENDQHNGSGPALNGSAKAGREPRHGIIGMRERISALGGELNAGTLPDGGFLVSAELPLPGDGQR